LTKKHWSKDSYTSSTLYMRLAKKQISLQISSIFEV